MIPAKQDKTALVKDVQGAVLSQRPTVLELRSVSCAYGTDRPAIHDISFAAQEGEILCLLGPSGCGKTTTLRAIAGFETVSAGEILLGGRLVSSPGFRVPAEERRVGMVFQEYALFPHLRVAENVAFGLQHLSRDEQRARVRHMLELVDLPDLARRYPHELSGGQQQRIALARALAQEPVILMLDEPFSNLDPDMAGKMRQDLHVLLRHTKTTTILVTHDHDEAFAMADRIAVLNDGRLEQMDTPEAIYHTPSTPFVADFVGQADFLPGTIEDGHVTTEIGEFPVHTAYRGGRDVVVMVRPDDVHIAPLVNATAYIQARMFHGSENLYTISLPSGRTVHSSEPSTTVYPVGTPVELQVIATHTVLFDRSRNHLPST
jgi:iron(III) transport system ATP-binding protein